MDEKDSKKYELAYLLSPLVPADKLDETLNQEVFSVITGLNGEITFKSNPDLKKLAYTIKKVTHNQRSSFKDAYFGYVQFTALPEVIDELNNKLKKSEQLVRFLLIMALKVADKEIKIKPTEAIETLAKEESIDILGDHQVDEATIDREIEGLLATA